MEGRVNLIALVRENNNINKRQENKVADILSKTQIPNGNLFWCYNYIPRFITTLLHQDFVISSIE